jgi:hypothetical protein
MKRNAILRITPLESTINTKINHSPGDLKCFDRRIFSSGFSSQDP